MPRLDLVPLYLPEHEGLLERLTPPLEAALAAQARRRVAWFDPEPCFDASRGQYSSTRLLARLLEDPGPPADWILGVTGVDLFVPVLTYVFGEAQLAGRAAIVSVHRLRPEAYGLSPDAALLDRRLLKEALHELGHVLGLVHCPDPQCVMRASTYVEDIDSKSGDFCELCLHEARRGASLSRSR